ncbi:ABC transporter substrate-binding protein [Inconstantimicrobium porci]|uniref:ABC transporter substrate-binding protein n=1 Tax=Inconstantimicrobium porci TaxID=2652291 RepID=A0A7X2N0N9_9CLOT|nr:MqnA/MqnD/SBP family protein [Inconstantimicrobium porci]MDD6771447.1 PhnD/SsuA/transferrin family substrate-binding protein [Inconstantimicrobium porci]MSR92574.1 ABC transporter substrate-binding protein [Inconstantimicrobium porci]
MGKKLISVLTAATMAAALLMGCGGNNTAEKNTAKTTKEAKTINMIVPDGLPAVALSKFMTDTKKIDNVTINSSIEKTTEALSTAIMKGEPDVAVVPSNLAAQAYNKKVGYKILGTVGWGSMYLVSTDSAVKQLSDIKGKEVYCLGKGLTPDIAFKSVLKQNNIDADKDVNITYVSAASELPPVVIGGKAKLAVVPEPALTAVKAKKKDLNVICNLNDEWKKILDSDYGFPQSTLIVKESLLKNDKEFVNKLADSAKENVKWVNDNKDKVGAMSEKLGVTVKAVIVAKALEDANLDFVNIKDSEKVYTKYFEELNKYQPKIIGGKVPDAKIFTSQN